MVVDTLFPTRLDANGSTFSAYGGYGTIGFEQEGCSPIGICSEDASFGIGDEELRLVVHAHGSQRCMTDG